MIHYQVTFVWRNGATARKAGSSADAVCSFSALDRDDADDWAREAFVGTETINALGHARPRYGTCNDGVLRRTASADRIEVHSVRVVAPPPSRVRCSACGRAYADRQAAADHNVFCFGKMVEVSVPTAVEVEGLLQTK